MIEWGEQIRPLTVARGRPGAEVNEQHVAGYLAKYATEATEPAGHLSARLTESTVRIYADPAKHTGRLVAAAWTLGRPDAGDYWSRLRPWAHMLGFGGHFATKSRAYSTTFGALRAARSAAMRRANATATSPELEEEDTVLVVGSWTYAGTGWRTTADAALALAAADAARSRPTRHRQPRRLRKETDDGNDRRAHVDAGRRVRVPASSRADALPVAAQGVRPQGRRVGKHLRWRPDVVRAWFDSLET